MMKFKYLIAGLIIVLLYSCSNETTNENTNKETIIEKCPCDSIGVFNENGKKEIECYTGKSLINIKSKSHSDTIEVTRYYTSDSIWHVQEYLVIANNKIIYPSYAMYCDIKDTADFYKLTHVSDEFRFSKKNYTVSKILGIEVKLYGENIRSNYNYALVPKSKFNDIIKVDKKAEVIINGKKDVSIASIYIEAKSMMKYGNLLEQYKAIKKQCSSM